MSKKEQKAWKLCGQLQTMSDTDEQADNLPEDTETEVKKNKLCT